MNHLLLSFIQFFGAIGFLAIASPILSRIYYVYYAVDGIPDCLEVQSSSSEELICRVDYLEWEGDIYNPSVLRQEKAAGFLEKNGLVDVRV